jgi:hypothetical protein
MAEAVSELRILFTQREKRSIRKEGEFWRMPYDW